MTALLPTLRSRFRREARAGLHGQGDSPLVREADLEHLPPPVAGYLRRAGVVGKPRVSNFHARFRGQIRAKPDGPWLDFRAEQWSFYRPRARLFLLDSSPLGLPFVAFHRYVGSAATMEVKAASLVTVVDARGPEMNQSETVTMLNDMCVLAPATLIEPDVHWEALGPQSVKATFSNAGNSISAVLLFNERSELVSFYSDDRYLSSDGKTYTLYRWSTPLSDYRDFDGVTLAALGKASWSMPAGDLEYGRFELVSIHYNVLSESGGDSGSGQR